MIITGYLHMATEALFKLHEQPTYEKNEKYFTIHKKIRSNVYGKNAWQYVGTTKPGERAIFLFFNNRTFQYGFWSVSLEE